MLLPVLDGPVPHTFPIPYVPIIHCCLPVAATSRPVGVLHLRKVVGMTEDFLSRVDSLREERDRFRQACGSRNDRTVIQTAGLRLRQALATVELLADGAGPLDRDGASGQRWGWLLLVALVNVTRSELSLYSPLPTGTLSF